MIKKYNFLKKYEINSKIDNSDVWLLFYNKQKQNNFFYKYLYNERPEEMSIIGTHKKNLKSFFFLRLDRELIKQKKRFISLYKVDLINKKIFFNFFYNVTIFQLRKLCNIVKKRKFYQFFNFIDLIETRLDSVLYRSNFFLTISSIRHFIKKKYIYINHKINTLYFFNLKIGDFISFIPTLVYLLKKEFSYNLLKKEKVIYNTNYYLFINYKILYLYLFNKPSMTYINEKQIYYPENLNMQQILNNFSK